MQSFYLCDYMNFYDIAYLKLHIIIYNSGNPSDTSHHTERANVLPVGGSSTEFTNQSFEYTKRLVLVSLLSAVTVKSVFQCQWKCHQAKYESPTVSSASFVATYSLTDGYW